MKLSGLLVKALKKKKKKSLARLIVFFFTLTCTQGHFKINYIFFNFLNVTLFLIEKNAQKHNDEAQRDGGQGVTGHPAPQAPLLAC